MARILLAEDDAAVSTFVDRALRHRGHEVTAVPDGPAALGALAAADFELLLTDIVMPGLDGIALALKASKDHPAMKILLMTGFSSERQRAHNLEALVHRVITSRSRLTRSARRSRPSWRADDLALSTADPRHGLLQRLRAAAQCLLLFGG